MADVHQIQLAEVNAHLAEAEQRAKASRHHISVRFNHDPPGVTVSGQRDLGNITVGAIERHVPLIPALFVPGAITLAIENVENQLDAAKVRMP